jgi:hypothetical protein
MRKHSDHVKSVTPLNVANPGTSPDLVAKSTNKDSKSTANGGQQDTGKNGAFSSHSVRPDRGGEGG